MTALFEAKASTLVWNTIQDRGLIGVVRFRNRLICRFWKAHFRISSLMDPATIARRGFHGAHVTWTWYSTLRGVHDLEDISFPTRAGKQGKLDY
jgi:hypothetical protein